MANFALLLLLLVGPVAAQIDCDFRRADICGWSATDASSKAPGSAYRPTSYSLHLQLMTQEDKDSIVDFNSNNMPSSVDSYDGNYAFVTMGELTKSKSHSKLKLVSPTFPTGASPHGPNREVTRCFSFWYRSAGWSRTQPAVFAVSPVVSSGGRNFFHFNITADGGHFWRFRQLDLSFDETYDQIQFAVDAGDTYFSYVAIDNVKLGQESCADSATLGSNYRQLDGNCPGNFLAYVGEPIGCSRCSLTECIRMCEAYPLCRGVSWVEEPPTEIFPAIYQCYLKATACDSTSPGPDRGGYNFYQRLSGFQPTSPQWPNTPSITLPATQPPPDPTDYWSTNEPYGITQSVSGLINVRESNNNRDNNNENENGYTSDHDHEQGNYGQPMGPPMTPPISSMKSVEAPGGGFYFTHQPNAAGDRGGLMPGMPGMNGLPPGMPPGMTAIPFSPMGLPGFTVLPANFQRGGGGHIPPIAFPGMSKEARLWLPRASAVQDGKDTFGKQRQQQQQQQGDFEEINNNNNGNDHGDHQVMVVPTEEAGIEELLPLSPSNPSQGEIVPRDSKVSKEDPTVEPMTIPRGEQEDDSEKGEGSVQANKPQFLYGYVPLQPFGNCGGHFIVDEAHQYLGCPRCSFAQCATLCSLSDQCRGFSFTESVLVAKQCYLKTASTCEPQPSSTGFKYFIKINRRQQAITSDPTNYNQQQSPGEPMTGPSVPAVETLFPPSFLNTASNNNNNNPHTDADSDRMHGTAGYSQLAGNCPGSFLRDSSGQTVVCARCSLAVCEKLCDQSEECLGVSYSLDPLVAVQCYPKTVANCSPLSQNTGYVFYSKNPTRKR